MDDRALFLRPHEAAILLNIHRSRMYSLLTNGTIPAIRLEGGHWRIPRAAINRLVEQALAGLKDNNEVAES